MVTTIWQASAGAPERGTDNMPGRTVLSRSALCRLIAAACVLLFVTPVVADARAGSPPTPKEWVRNFWPTARAAGIDRDVYDEALGSFSPDPDVVKKVSTQAEFNTQIWDYLDMMVSDDRLVEGKAALAKYGRLLARVEAAYGVDRYVLAAIWGMESHYGAALTNPKLIHGTVRALATLAYGDGRYGKYGRTQLIAALKIIQHGDIPVSAMTGSWAGAMGQTQFIPTTYNAFAVDFDGDGKRNIWTSPADALGSAANYLKKSGWQAGRTWGYEVLLPGNFDMKKAGGERSVKEWMKLGVSRPGGKLFPRPNDKAVLYIPAAGKGPAFLLLANFRVIKRYNNASSYALAVGHLADRLRGGDAFVTPWADHEVPLTLEERTRLQKLLAARGLYDGAIDGDLGSGSREAVRTYQLAIGETPDGVGSRAVLQALEAGR